MVANIYRDYFNRVGSPGNIFLRCELCCNRAKSQVSVFN